uniref:Uncharacterized protein n=1 Tax=Trepomonas sp. PC1 TaxID=1076344 RepID=A0A146KG87_9EUKA|eukprot:JAP95713.1 hypothetical protein TPC1_11199 [Trepomonas sp. PC1]
MDLGEEDYDDDFKFGEDEEEEEMEEIDEDELFEGLKGMGVPKNLPEDQKQIFCQLFNVKKEMLERVLDRLSGDKCHGCHENCKDCPQKKTLEAPMGAPAAQKKDEPINPFAKKQEQVNPFAKKEAKQEPVNPFAKKDAKQEPVNPFAQKPQQEASKEPVNPFAKKTEPVNPFAKQEPVNPFAKQEPANPFANKIAKPEAAPNPFSKTAIPKPSSAQTQQVKQISVDQFLKQIEAKKPLLEQLSLIQKTSDKANFQMLQEIDLGAETEVPQEKICFKCIECGLTMESDDLGLQKHKEHTLALLKVPHQVPINDLDKLSIEKADLEKTIVVMHKYLIQVHSNPQKCEKTFDQFADMLEGLQDLCAICGAITIAPADATLEDIVQFILDGKEYQNNKGCLYEQFCEHYSDMGQFVYDMAMISKQWRHSFIKNLVQTKQSEAQFQILLSLNAFEDNWVEIDSEQKSLQNLFQQLLSQLQKGGKALDDANDVFESIQDHYGFRKIQLNEQSSKLVCQLAEQSQIINERIIDIKQQLLTCLQLCTLKNAAVKQIEDDCAILFGFMMMNSDIEISKEFAEQIVAQSTDLFALENQSQFNKVIYHILTKYPEFKQDYNGCQPLLIFQLARNCPLEEIMLINNIDTLEKMLNYHQFKLFGDIKLIQYYMKFIQVRMSEDREYRKLRVQKSVTKEIHERALFLKDIELDQENEFAKILKIYLDNEELQFDSKQPQEFVIPMNGLKTCYHKLQTDQQATKKCWCGFEFDSVLDDEKLAQILTEIEHGEDKLLLIRKYAKLAVLLNKKSGLKIDFPTSFNLFTDCEQCDDCEQPLLVDYEAAHYCLKCKKYFHTDCNQCQCNFMLNLQALVIKKDDLLLSAPYVDKYTQQKAQTYNGADLLVSEELLIVMELLIRFNVKDELTKAQFLLVKMGNRVLQNLHPEDYVELAEGDEHLEFGEEEEEEDENEYDQLDEAQKEELMKQIQLALKKQQEKKDDKDEKEKDSDDVE